MLVKPALSSYLSIVVEPDTTPLIAMLSLKELYIPRALFIFPPLTSKAFITPWALSSYMGWFDSKNAFLNPQQDIVSTHTECL